MPYNADNENCDIDTILNMTVSKALLVLEIGKNIYV